jgi:ATP-dependent RNA circularization protein (DNA/RNA ligase family)
VSSPADTRLSLARKYWVERPEPILVLGFDSKDHVVKRDEDGLLQNNGISYLCLPASLNDIREAIVRLANQSRGKLAPALVRKNWKAFESQLRAYWHELKNVISALTAAINSLERATTKEGRVVEFQLLSAQNQELIAAVEESFRAVISEFPETATRSPAAETVAEISSELAMANSIYERLREHLSTGYSEQTHHDVVEDGRLLLGGLNSVGNLINDIAPKHRLERP